MPSSRRMEETLNTLTLPDLPVIPLPPLPPVTSVDLLQTALTHTSLLSLPRKTLDLDPQHPVKDYEKLEHVGDAVLGVVITLLLHDLFPYLREGPATFLKGHLVRDRTLAQLSDRYGLPDQMIGHKAALASTKRQEKNRSSLFEAYIAALYLSHVEEFHRQHSALTRSAEDFVPDQPRGKNPGPESDTSVTSKPDDSALAPSIATPTEGAAPVCDNPEDITRVSATQPASAVPGSEDPPLVSNTDTEKGSPDRVSCVTARPGECSTPQLSGRGYALAKVDEWLRPLFTPLAHWALDGMRAEQTRLEACPPPKPAAIKIPAEWAAEDEQAAGMAGALNVYVQNTSGNMPAYHYDELDERDPANPHTAMWRATCVTRGKNGVVSAEACRFTKRGAQAVAAWKVYQQLGGP